MTYQLAPLTMSGAARLGALDDDRNLRITSAHEKSRTSSSGFGIAGLSVGVVTVRVVPSNLHEMLVELFRARPSLAAGLLGGVLGVPVPEFGHAQLEATDCTDLAPTEYRADAVVVFSGDRGPVFSGDRGRCWRWWSRYS